MNKTFEFTQSVGMALSAMMGLFFRTEKQFPKELTGFFWAMGWHMRARFPQVVKASPVITEENENRGLRREIVFETYFTGVNSYQLVVSMVAKKPDHRMCTDSLEMKGTWEIEKIAVYDCPNGRRPKEAVFQMSWAEVQHKYLGK